jgi:hypothetical protein
MYLTLTYCLLYHTNIVAPAPSSNVMSFTTSHTAADPFAEADAEANATTNPTPDTPFTAKLDILKL